MISSMQAYKCFNVFPLVCAGSPFGTPMQGGQAHGSFPGNTQYTQGYGHPHPGYH